MIGTATCADNRVPEIVLELFLRPSGRVMLFGTIATLDPFKELALGGDPCLWIRWAEANDTKLGDPRIEFAASEPQDEPQGMARIVARSAPLETENARAVYEAVEAQGAADFLLFEEASADSLSPQYLHWIVSFDLTRKLEAFGLRAEGAPTHYC